MLDESKIKSNIKIIFENEPTFLTIIANHNSFEFDKNLYVKQNRICLSPVCFDSINSCYCFSGIDYLNLGQINQSLYFEFEGVRKRVPLPESVILKRLTIRQRNLFEEFKDFNKSNDASYKWYQFI